MLGHEYAEHIGHRLIQSAGLVGVDQPSSVLDHAMGQFVADHLEAGGEASEDFTVSITEDHASAVPEGVLVALAVMDGAQQAQPGVVDRVAALRLAEELPGGTEPVVGLINCPVAGGWFALTAHPLTR